MKAFTPQISKLPDRKVITITSFGDPNKVTEPYMKALYGAAYWAKMKVYKPKEKNQACERVVLFNAIK